jgi:hypothetical protein
LDEDREEGLLTSEGVPATRYGVEISFVEGYPPTAIKQYSEIETLVRVENKGSYAVDAGETEILVEASDFISTGDAQWTNQESLEGAISEGFGEDLVIEDFGKLTYSGLVFEGKKIPSEITARACYYYESNVIGQLCLKPHPEVTSSICLGSETENIIQTHSSAPIRVTSVLQKIYADHIEMKINVKNLGKGDPYKINTDCTGKKEKGYVFLDKLYIGTANNKEDMAIRCGDKTARSKRLTSEGATFKCSLPNTVSSVITEPFEAVIAYRYSTSTTKELSVEAGSVYE